MRTPPRDADGCVEPHDHEQIQDEDIMLRGIPAQWIKPAPDGGRRISSGASSRPAINTADFLSARKKYWNAWR